MRTWPPSPPSLNTLLRVFCWACLWCGRMVIVADPRSTSKAATREHLIPKALGGQDSANNIALACVRCNNRRGKSLAWPEGTPGPTDALVNLSEGHRWAWGRLLGRHNDPAPWADPPVLTSTIGDALTARAR